MAGYPAHNYPAFHAMAAELRKLGWTVVNPAEINPIEDGQRKTRTECLRADVRAMMDCDKIYLLKGWEDSLGANLELHIAKELGFAIYWHPDAVAPSGTFVRVAT